MIEIVREMPPALRRPPPAPPPARAYGTPLGGLFPAWHGQSDPYAAFADDPTKGWHCSFTAEKVDESGGLITRAHDITGNGRHATGTGTERPTLNTATLSGSRAMMVFNGSTNVLRTFASAADAFMAAGQPFTIAFHGYLYGYLGTTNTWCGVAGTTSDTYPTWVFSAAASKLRGYRGGQHVESGASLGVPTNQEVFVAMIYRGSTSHEVRLYVRHPTTPTPTAWLLNAVIAEGGRGSLGTGLGIALGARINTGGSPANFTNVGIRRCALLNNTAIGAILSIGDTWYGT